ncbi:18777_t:CDS:2 [Gigaspora margarita]|uniref:18777_t:CDS:1 n=1 Tax=Gigaspora margarita TaxID=4874 RepID=A0ABN7V643_GIGMA|nr:18777_t:CDS:2 [Gigaspora margarita]
MQQDQKSTTTIPSCYRKKINRLEKNRMKTTKIVASTSNTQSKKIKKREIKPKQTKLNSTKNFDQSDTMVINTATKNYKGKENHKIFAIQRDNLKYSLKMDHKEDFERFEEDVQNAAKVLDASIVRQMFEYSEGVCQNHRYACEHQDHNIVKNKTNIKTGMLSISSVNLVHNNHLLENETNKFASKYRALSEDMLKDIKFWTKTGNINMKTQYQILIERSNSLTSLYWVSTNQHDLYMQYQDIIQHDNTYSTNQFKMALGFFVAIDNNNRSRFIDQALMNDEIAESYEWGLQTS